MQQKSEFKKSEFQWKEYQNLYLQVLYIQQKCNIMFVDQDCCFQCSLYLVLYVIYIYLLMFYVKFLFPAFQHNSELYILYPFTIQDNEWILSEHALSLSSCLLQNIFVQNL